MVWCTCFSAVAVAHRVNIFAFVDGDAIQVQCSFSKSQKVRNGRLLISDADNGALLSEAFTDDQGSFRFRPSEDFLQSRHALRILLKAGEGHQNEWVLSSETLTGLSGYLPHIAAENRNGDSFAVSTNVEAESKKIGSVIAYDEWEARMERLLDTKLAPFRQILAENQQTSPTFRDIFGGIGWILGLLGIATYMKYKKNV
jgi:nickel transport protein